MSVLPNFNDLVREAFDAQEEFDMHDSDWSDIPLERVIKEWREANHKLIQFVIENALELIAENEE